MKVLFTTLVYVAMSTMMISCNEKTQENTPAMPEANATEDELRQAVNDREELIGLVTEINDGIAEIKDLEKIVTIDNGETPNERARLIADIAAIRDKIAEREARLAELEQKLKTSNIYSEKLKSTIETLRKQIDKQNEEISNLTRELGIAKETITQQTAKIDTLTTTVQNVSNDLASSQQANLELKNDINRCFYVIGSDKELKEHKIIEKGFLRKTKILEGDYEQNYFTIADKRTLTTIPLYSKKAEVMTKQSKDSYVIEEGANGMKVLKITDPAKFWQLTNYLVIKIN